MISFLTVARGIPFTRFQLFRECTSRSFSCMKMTQKYNDKSQDVPSSLERSQRVRGIEPRKTFKRKIVMFVAYDGAAYAGFQRNLGVRTVSDILEEALHSAEVISDENVGSLSKISWVVAARTDKGVCAASNAVSFKAAFPRDNEESTTSLSLDFVDFVRKVNLHLPRDVRVLGAAKPTGSFSAKDACSGRSYEYLLPMDALLDNPSLSDFSDILAQFEGSHYFHNFTIGKEHRSPPPAQASRYMTNCRCDLDPVWRDDSGTRRGFIRIIVQGQSFMLHQIRKMIALSVLVYRGILPANSVKESFDRAVLINLAPVPASGLFLDSVLYDAYNKRYDRHLEAPISPLAFKKQIDEFKASCIYPSIVRRCEVDDTMDLFFDTVERHPPVFRRP